MSLATALILLMTSVSPAEAAVPWEVGDGRYRSSVLRQINAPPMQELGDDALRFSTEPQLGGEAIVIETARVGWGSHMVSVERFTGHFRTGWKRTGSWEFRISDREYASLTSRVDQLIVVPDPKPGPERGTDSGDRPGTVYELVCTDGPGIMTERERANRSIWRRGSCGPDHPNLLVRQIMLDLVRRHLGARALPRN